MCEIGGFDFQFIWENVKTILINSVVFSLFFFAKNNSINCLDSGKVVKNKWKEFACFLIFSLQSKHTYLFLFKIILLNFLFFHFFRIHKESFFRLIS